MARSAVSGDADAASTEHQPARDQDGESDQKRRTQPWLDIGDETVEELREHDMETG